MRLAHPAETRRPPAPDAGLVIDARMWSFSGVGTYLQALLPRVMAPLQPLDPVVLALPEDYAHVAHVLSPHASVETWPARPLGTGDLGRPPARWRHHLWWVPHFNVPLRAAGPLVVTLHDLLPLHDGRQLGARAIAVRCWTRAIARRARRVICVSENTREIAVRLAGIPLEITAVCPLGVEAVWRPSPTTGAERGAPPYLVCVGLLKRHKNTAGLLRAFESLMSRIPHRLVIVGRYQGLRDFDRVALALARRLAPRVELRAGLPLPELVELVARAELLVQPSFHEGFGLPVLEAMAAGVPVLAAKAGALPEVAGDAAEYCDPHSVDDMARAIERIVSDPALRVRMRDRGLARARAFTWDNCADCTADLILAAAQVGSPA